MDGHGYLTKARLIAKWKRDWGQGPSLLGPSLPEWLSFCSPLTFGANIFPLQACRSTERLTPAAFGLILPAKWRGGVCQSILPIPKRWVWTSGCRGFGESGSGNADKAWLEGLLPRASNREDCDWLKWRQRTRNPSELEVARLV